MAEFMQPGTHFNIKTVIPGMRIPILKIRRSRDHLIFNMGIPLLVRQHLYIEMAPEDHPSSIVLNSLNIIQWFIRDAIHQAVAMVPFGHHVGLDNNLGRIYC